MPFFKKLDKHSDITDILFEDPKRFGPISKFTELVMRGDSDLSVSERELIASFVSGLNACSYCLGTHTEVAKRYGVSASLIEDLLTDLEGADISPKLLPILKYVQKLTLTPSRMVLEDAEAVYRAGWTEQALYDAICICSLFNFYNRLIDGHGIKGHHKLYELGADHLSKRGYIIPFFINYIKGAIKKSKLKELMKGED